jgi:rSAM/selenodomain-associated transferase 1
MAADTALLVFAKAPLAGRAKSRLIPALGAADAARLHGHLVRQTLEKVAGQADWDTQLWCAPDSTHPFFCQVADQYGVRLRNQAGDNLGARMADALRVVLQTYRRAVLIGTDCPDLSLEDLRRAYALLVSGNDVVLGPAADGGYYLIGMNREIPELFQGIIWGSGSVLGATRDKLAALDLNWCELTEHHDLDRPADLARYPGLLASIGERQEPC